MQLVEVKSKKEIKDFLEVPLLIYKNDGNWIRPLDKDIEFVFDSGQNKFFKHGAAIRWLLKNDEGKVIGRVAAFVNSKSADREDQPTGGMGFFECIDDKKASVILFDACKNWLLEKGMEAMDGPINFGERDKWWGLLAEGFTPPVYCMNYNPPYYNDLFEHYGFKIFFNQFCYSLNVMNRPQEKFYERYDKFAKDPDYRAEHIHKNNLRKFAADFATVYNKAWAGHFGNKQMSTEQVMLLFKKAKPILDEELAWFVYYKNEPVAFWFNLPEINTIIKRLNGKFGLISKLKFLWLKNRGLCRKFIGLIFGIAPEFQGTGLDGFLIISGANALQKSKRYDDLEMQWIGDFNPKMINIVENLGTTKSRTLRTYRYIFDPGREFKRHPILH